MPIPDLEKARAMKALEQFCSRHNRPDLRHLLWYDARFERNAAFIFEHRPSFQNRNEWTELAVAKCRYNVSHVTWELLWSDRNSKWHVYESLNPTRSIEPLLAEVDRDPTGIFWG
jgi:hypothetical protein